MATSIAVTGLVQVDASFSADDLEQMPSLTADVAALAPGAVGSAIHVRDLLESIELKDEATHCTVISAREGYRASIPLADLYDGGWIAFGLDGLPLPDDKGGPFRLTVAQGTTLCWNVKDVGEMHFAAEREPDDVPENPPH